METRLLLKNNARPTVRETFVVAVLAANLSAGRQ